MSEAAQARANALGAATLGLTLLAVLLARPRARDTASRTKRVACPRGALSPSLLTSPPSALPGATTIPPEPGAAINPVEPRRSEAHVRAAGQLYLSAAMLAASVLSDSAVEHYRGGYDNPGMFASLAGAALALAWSAHGARHPARPAPILPFGAVCAIGAAGMGFHTYNVLHRPGGLSWSNLFYGAPLAAPAALALAGVLGLSARAAASPSVPAATTGTATIAAMPTSATAWLSSARALCAIAAIGLVGTSLEAALLHFRGAYHHPAMWLPVALPPVGAALLVADVVRQPAAPRLLTRIWLQACSWLGAIGTVFHARGVARQMGGWRNWSQNLLSGPPIPAPPAFSALALAGRAALSLRACEAAMREAP